MLITVVYVLIFVFAGLIMYAYYAGCDPLITGKISAGDQVGYVLSFNLVVGSRTSHQTFEKHFNDDYFISHSFQMVPYFILDLFQDAAGFPGMFTAAVFGATLRYHSSPPLPTASENLLPCPTFYV